MSDSENTEDFLQLDPTRLTIPQLKAYLSRIGVELPPRTEKKQYYIDLFIAKQVEHRKVLFYLTSIHFLGPSNFSRFFQTVAYNLLWR